MFLRSMMTARVITTLDARVGLRRRSRVVMTLAVITTLVFHIDEAASSMWNTGCYNLFLLLLFWLLLFV